MPDLTDLSDEVLIATLTRRGVLQEQWTVRHAQGTHPGPFTEKQAREWIASDIKNDECRQRGTRGKQALLHRYVTAWAPVPTTEEN